MMRQQSQYVNSGMDAYGGNQNTQPLEYASGDYQGQFEAFTPPRDDTYLDSKVEPHQRWDRDGSDPSHSAAGRMMYEGQGIDTSRSYYQGQIQRQVLRMHLERHGSSDNRPPRNNSDMDVEYEKSPFRHAFEALERKFLDDISKLAKELTDSEDAENTRHREKISAINAQYHELLISLRTKHTNRRDEFLRRESTARQQHYKKAIIDQYSSSGPRNPQNFGGSSILGTAGPYNISDRYESFVDGSRHYSGMRGHAGERTYDKGARFK